MSEPKPKLPVLWAMDCPQCECCDEPWCDECDDHYADCNHPGPSGSRWPTDGSCEVDDE